MSTDDDPVGEAGQGVHVGAAVGAGLGVLVGDDCIGTDTGAVIGMMATVGNEVIEGAAVVVGDLVADAAGWVGDGGTGEKVAG